MKPKKDVLFLCTHNSARSQMAEGLLRNMYGEHYNAYSAGESETEIHPLAVKVMEEIGVDITNQGSKKIDRFTGKVFDYVITVCKSTKSLPCKFCSMPGEVGAPLIIRKILASVGRFVEHGFEDPSQIEGSYEEKTQAFRDVRDEINLWIEEYFKNKH